MAPHGSWYPITQWKGREESRPRHGSACRLPIERLPAPSSKTCCVLSLGDEGAVEAGHLALYLLVTCRLPIRCVDMRCVGMW